MARPKKLARSVAPLPAREWAPLDEAFDRVKFWVGSVQLACRQLPQDLLAGQLQGAARCIRDGTETWLTFNPAWWQSLKISPPILLLDSTDRCRVEGEADGWDRKREKRYFFVHRVELHKLYPVADLDKLYSVAVPSEQADNPTSRRKPGHPPKHDWPMVVARELIRMALAGEKMPPTAPKMLQFCENKLRWQPDIRQMQRLLSKLLD
jgi:hypothetical protein